jgi:hypothetical protein
MINKDSRPLTTIFVILHQSMALFSNYWRHNTRCGPGSVVCIATVYGLDGPRIGSRWGEIFRTSEAHTASCTMGTGSFPGVRCGRGVTLTPHTLLVTRSKIE